MRDQLFHGIMESWPSSGAKDSEQLRLRYSYFFGGMLAMWHQWLLDPGSITAAQLAADLQVLINQAMTL